MVGCDGYVRLEGHISKKDTSVWIVNYLKKINLGRYLKRTHQKNKLVGCDGYVRKNVREQSLALGGAHIRGQWATNMNSNRRGYLKDGGV